MRPKFFGLTVLLGATAGLLASGGAVGAATLGDASGAVLVDTGGGFRPAPVGASLPTGSRVMARNGGQAKVAYEDLCVVVVEPGRVYTVANKSPCAQGAQANVGNPLPMDYALIAGGVAIGGGILVYQATKKSSPASP